MIAAVADASYTAVTVADIVAGAKVSRSAFYAQFADKEDCFLTATRAVPAHAPDEPAFARVLHVDLPTAGPMAAERPDEANRRFADLNRKWHTRAHTRHPEWPSVPGQAYQARPGASSELIRPYVRAGQTETPPSLEETLMSPHMAVLAARPWTA